MKKISPWVFLVAALILPLPLLAWSGPGLNPPPTGGGAIFQSGNALQTNLQGIIIPSGGLAVGTTTLQATGTITLTGTLNAQNLNTSGALSGSLSAGYVSAGIFGSLSTKGNYTFQASGNSNPVLFVDAVNEEVGIGTVNPGAKLDVQGAAVVSGNISLGSSGNLYLGGPTDSGVNGVRMFTNDGAGGGFIDVRVSNENTKGLIIRISSSTGGTERVRVLGNGNVGIGTASPGQKLTVAGTIESTSGGFKFPDGTTQTTAGAGGVTGSGSAGYLSKFTAGTVVGNSVVYESAGRIGLGTTNPTGGVLHISTITGNHIYLYDVTDGDSATIGLGVGYASFAASGGLIRLGGSTYPSNASYTLGTPTSRWGNAYTAKADISGGYTSPGQVKITGSSGNHAYLGITADNGNEAGIQIQNAGITRWNIYRPASTNDLRFYDTADRLTIQAGGKVGIGTSNPSYKLHSYDTDSGARAIYGEVIHTAIGGGGEVGVYGKASKTGSLSGGQAIYGVYGEAQSGAYNGYGVFGSGTTIGVFGTGYTGVYGSGLGDSSRGVSGYTSGQSSFGVYGFADGAESAGVLGFTDESTGVGVHGQGFVGVRSTGYLELEQTSSGSPPAADCDSDSERGRMSIDTSNNRLYVCNGSIRGWDYISLTN